MPKDENNSANYQLRSFLIKSLGDTFVTDIEILFSFIDEILF
tara:strand:+ start:24756 stop:24881 length:126 start_codon:yes stop_codon:yes gene_type:complete